MVDSMSEPQLAVVGERLADSLNICESHILKGGCGRLFVYD